MLLLPSGCVVAGDPLPAPSPPALPAVAGRDPGEYHVGTFNMAGGNDDVYDADGAGDALVDSVVSPGVEVRGTEVTVPLHSDHEMVWSDLYVAP